MLVCDANVCSLRAYRTRTPFACEYKWSHTFYIRYNIRYMYLCIINMNRCICTIQGPLTPAPSQCKQKHIQYLCRAKLWCWCVCECACLCLFVPFSPNWGKWKDSKQTPDAVCDSAHHRMAHRKHAERTHTDTLACIHARTPRNSNRNTKTHTKVYIKKNI